MNLIESAKAQIDEILSEACQKARLAGNLPGDEPLSGSVEIPRESAHGDFAATHAMAAARELKMSPRKIAEALAECIDLGTGYFESFSIAGPGFINFTLSAKWYSEVLQAVETMEGSYGASDIGAGRRVMVEFVSANPTGPMTIGNARGGVLGDTLASILQRAGYDVWREFYVNDAGNQVHLFGSSISARYMQLCPGFEDYPFPDDGYHGEDIKELAQLVFSAEGETLATLHEEERIARLTGFALPYNIAKMKEHLERYRIHFDEWFLESRLHDSEFIEDTVNILKDGGLIYEKDGALWLKNVELGADKDEVLLRANGFYTYYAVDIAYHRDKIARGFDRVVDIWGADHHGHSLRMKASMSADALGGIGDKLDFLIYQMVSLTRDGETYKVSKRTGRALTLSDLLDEIPVDACRFFFNARPDSHLEFDLDLAVRQDSDNPVYYVQYAHARICSLINMLSSDGVSVPRCADADLMALTSAVELDLIKQIAGLPDEITHAARDYDPSRINKYVIELAARFHRFYNSCRIRGEEPGLLLARLKLADSTRSVIANCLGLLGVTAPTAM